MKVNQIGSSDLYVSELTLGCMSLGTDYQKARRIIDEAIDMGINHLDTADLYGFGDNERIVGEAIKHKRDQLILTTKVGNHFNRVKKDWYWDPSKEHIISSAKASLRRLKTDYIDLYLLHGGTIDDPIEESIDAFEQLKKEGIIRAYGISSIRPNVINAYVTNSNIDAVMLQYNLLDRRPEENILTLLHKHKISVLARGPLAKGILIDSPTRNKKLNESYLNYTKNDVLHIIQQLEAYQNMKRLKDIAFKYVLFHPVVASAVFGVRSVEQLIENLSFDSSHELSSDAYQYIQHVTKAIRYINHRI
ncbi:aldo/keto reductase [Virgibacillus sp. W0430]|uniref:aldo/keto reductase n=1 Tax=Virgibacillus sp. W0430 TaxID=3391580 RepID=UPI003F45E68E